jgi:hypothetical protein
MERRISIPPRPPRRSRKYTETSPEVLPAAGASPAPTVALTQRRRADAKRTPGTVFEGLTGE